MKQRTLVNHVLGWGLVALLLLAGCKPITAPADATPAAQTQAGVYADPAGNYTVPIPTNWTAAPAAGFTLLQSPEGRIQVYIGALTGVALEDAVAQAWQQVDPTFDLTPSETQEIPSRPGVSRTLGYAYEPEDDQVVQAIAEQMGDLVYVTLVRGDLVEVSRRSAQISIIATGLKMTGVAEVDLRGVAPRPLTPAMLDELRTYTQDLLGRFDVPGAAVAVVQNGEVVLLEGFGVRVRGGSDPITPQTQMMIGSTGKTMTTLLMAQLVDEGRMTWDTPVQTILPEFAVADPELSARITVRNLVCACTGVPRRDFEFIFNARDLNAESVIASLRTFEFFTDFGEAFQYSNQLVATGGWVAAAAAGGKYGSLDQAYFDAMDAHVFGPIGMTATTFSFDKVIAGGNYAMPHDFALGGVREPLALDMEKVLLPVAPAGASWSTAEDMARYLITELGKGVTPDGTRIVSEENLGVTWTPQVPIDASTGYGLGWIVGTYKGQPLIQHGGNTLGFSTDFAFLPEANLGIVVMANGRITNAFNQAVRFRLLELAFDQPQEYDATASFMNEQITKSLAGAVEKTKEVMVEAVANFLGRYTNPALGEVELKFVEGKLLLDAGEFTSEVRTAVDESGAETGYVLVGTPLMGIPIEFTLDEARNSILVLGEGVIRYEFTPVQ